MTSSSSEFSDSDSAHTLDSPPTSPLRESADSNELDAKNLFSPYSDLLAFLNEFESAVRVFGIICFDPTLILVANRGTIGVA